MKLLNLTSCFTLFLIFISSLTAADEVDCDGGTQYSKPTGELCEANAVTCLTDLVCYIAQEDLANSNDYINIETAIQHFNLLFWHPRYLETKIPIDTYELYTRLQDSNNTMENLPEGTIIMKPASTPTTDTISSIDSEIELFIMYKPEGGYCPTDNQLSNGICPTGDWLWVHGFAYDPDTDEYSYRVSSSTSTAKSQKCIACHSLAARADSIFNLFISRKYGSIAE